MSTNTLNLVPEEKERVEKIYLEELESLKRDEESIASEFGFELKKGIFIDHMDEKFSFEENLKIFCDELGETEQEIFKKSREYGQDRINQALSRLRILREKAGTALSRAQTDMKGF